MMDTTNNFNPKDDLVEYKEKLAQLEKETLEQIQDLVKREEKSKEELLLKTLKKNYD